MSDTRSLRSTLLRRKPISAFVAETGATTEGGELKRTIGTFQLTMFGVGATIGTGIFIVLNSAVPEAGPGVILSFAIAGVTAALTALCYAELASMIPVSRRARRPGWRRSCGTSPGRRGRRWSCLSARSSRCSASPWS